MTHVVVRYAEPADLDAVAPLFDAYRRFYGCEPDVAAARAFLADRLTREESVILVALLGESSEGAGGAIAGFAQLYPSFSSVSLAPTLILNDLFVAAGARGQGIAGRLVDASVVHARRVGAVRLELATQHGNEPALRLYRAKGFVADNEFAHLSLSLA
jgi:ribosomal protein S18 acetylase RimI-like enzyme